jgi:hypothetical protein
VVSGALVAAGAVVAVVVGVAAGVIVVLAEREETLVGASDASSAANTALAVPVSVRSSDPQAAATLATPKRMAITRNRT